MAAVDCPSAATAAATKDKGIASPARLAGHNTRLLLRPCAASCHIVIAVDLHGLGAEEKGEGKKK